MVKTKICTTCRESRDLSRYYVRKNKKGEPYRVTICKECRTKHEMHRYHRVRKFIWDYKAEHPCVDCGEANPIVLEFDHINKEEKKFTIGHAPQTHSKKQLNEEIAKCEVRCANCHKKRTFAQLKHLDYGKITIKPWEHRKRVYSKTLNKDEN